MGGLRECLWLCRAEQRSVRTPRESKHRYAWSPFKQRHNSTRNFSFSLLFAHRSLFFFCLVKECQGFFSIDSSFSVFFLSFFLFSSSSAVGVCFEEKLGRKDYKGGEKMLRWRRLRQRSSSFSVSTFFFFFFWGEWKEVILSMTHSRWGVLSSGCPSVFAVHTPQQTCHYV